MSLFVHLLHPRGVQQLAEEHFLRFHAYDDDDDDNIYASVGLQQIQHQFTVSAENAVRASAKGHGLELSKLGKILF